MYNLDNLDNQLVNVISNYGDFNADDVFLYLIQSNEGKWKVSLLPIELPAKPELYKYRLVIQLKMHELLKLKESKAGREQVLSVLVPKTNARYTNLDREAKKDYN